VKAKGLEMVRSSTPAPCRTKLGEAMKLILSGTEEQLQKFVKEFRKEFAEMSFETVAFPRSVNDLEKYMDPVSKMPISGATQQVKASLAYNTLLRKLQLDNKYPLIVSGDKIRFCHMIVPNPGHCETMACPGSLPDELDMRDYVNYEEQFAKSFIKPLSLVIDKIGWSAYKRESLHAFFN
jgi:hypothetical protein